MYFWQMSIFLSLSIKLNIKVGNFLFLTGFDSLLKELTQLI